MSNDINNHKTLPPILSVGALSRRSGIAISAIHFYEREGLLRSTRNAVGHRRYSRASLRILAIIKAGQRAGIPLASIRHALGPAVSGDALGQDEWQRISEGWRADLEERIRTLELVRDRLSGCIRCGCLSHEACRMFNPGDTAAADGPGAKGLEVQHFGPDSAG
ncbi:redox-sensitive transcriptional activator SoxR [Paracoccus caeni]|uniref:Redox-sensitive transcriptional activator SoxR n=1 Tax=Paracoccus caeni TaxID=657651 RepID=A0A934W0Y1_9RHOB|nr:redox-sensitive transcriptional activator SoxR [Paracoccus caeni]MBK4216239.1 redox-sensitive transcriptional activator SoxR [Paracoccus caeni]